MGVVRGPGDGCISRPAPAAFQAATSCGGMRFPDITSTCLKVHAPAAGARSHWSSLARAKLAELFCRLLFAEKKEREKEKKKRIGMQHSKMKRKEEKRTEKKKRQPTVCTAWTPYQVLASVSRYLPTYQAGRNVLST